MNLEQNKLETIENYYGSIKAYSLFLENLAFNLPNNNVQSFLKDKRITSVASFGLASNSKLCRWTCNDRIWITKDAYW